MPPNLLYPFDVLWEKKHCLEDARVFPQPQNIISHSLFAVTEGTLIFFVLSRVQLSSDCLYFSPSPKYSVFKQCFATLDDFQTVCYIF